MTGSNKISEKTDLIFSDSWSFYTQEPGNHKKLHDTKMRLNIWLACVVF